MTLTHPDTFLGRLASLPTGQRHLIALAGPPGAGKSTLAAALIARLNQRSPGRAALLPMDGYHFDDRVLTARGMRARKGAPDTFDVGGFASMVTRLRLNAEPEIAIPVFDRDVEIARAAAMMIPREAEIVLVEGNYLLIDEGAWRGLAKAFDLTALLHVDEPELRRRLMARWAHLDRSEACAKVEANDLPNGLFVLRQSARPDVMLDGTAMLGPG